jgi:hypothetical protein
MAITIPRAHQIPVDMRGGIVSIYEKKVTEAVGLTALG